MTTIRSAEPKKDLDDARLLRELTRTVARLQRYSLRVCSGIGVAQCHVLTTLHDHGEMGLAEVVQRTRLDKAWVSRTVSALEAEGMLRRRPAEIDRRLIRLSLSAKGRARAAELDQALDGEAQRLLDHIPHRHRKPIGPALKRLYDAAVETERNRG